MKSVLDTTEVRRWKRYQDMRPFEIEWLGYVPKHWVTRRLSAVSDFLPGKAHEPYIEEGAPYICVNSKFVSTCGATVKHCTENLSPAKKNDILMVMSDLPNGRALAKAYIVDVDDIFAVNQRVCIIRSSPEQHSRFLFYHLSRHPYFLHYDDGIQQTHLSNAVFTKFPLLLPPLPEQRAIAAFLDRETARIDALIGHKQRLIQLLEEKRQAVISHSLEQQQEWPSVRLKFFSDILAGYAFKSEGFSRDKSDIRLLRGVNVAPGSTDWDDAVYWPKEDAYAFLEYELALGDLVFAMDRPWISSGIRVAEICESDLPCLLLQRVARLRAKNGLSQEYLRLLISSRQFEAYFDPILTGVSVPHISPTQILDFRFALPSPKKQCEICRVVANFATFADATQVRIEEGIGRLQEYRSALISAAVTGQIDVRDEVQLDG